LPGLFVARHLIPFLFFNRPTVAQPRVFAFFNSLRTSTSLPIGAAGFCWGGKHTFLLCNSDIAKTPDGKPLIDVAYSAHPSSLVLPKEAEEVKVPLCVSNGSMDMMLKADGVEMIKEAFKKKEGSEEGKYEMNVVDGAKHGFAVRGNPGDEEEKRKGQLAEDQAVDFFGKWLVQSK